LKSKVRFVAVGSCPNCHEEYVRPYPCDAAVCKCRNPEPTLVPLEPFLILPKSLYKPYERIAELTRVDVEDLINKVLEVGLKEKLEELVSLKQYG